MSKFTQVMAGMAFPPTPRETGYLSSVSGIPVPPRAYSVYAALARIKADPVQ